MQQKISWVTNLKFLGIIAVILGHIESPFTMFIFSWHMPLFFIVAGFFIKFDLTFKQFIVKDLRGLMVPYFIFSLIGVFFEIIKRYLLHRDSLNITNELVDIFIWMDMPSLLDTYAFVLWFLPALFFARIILFLINYYLKNIFMQILIVLLFFQISFFINLPFGIDNALNAILFIFIGHVFYKFYQESKILYIFPIMLIVVYLLIGIPHLDMATKTYSNIFINVLYAVFMIYTFILILKKLNWNNKLLKIWGENTLILFIIHPYTNNIAYILVNKLSFGGWYLKLFISLMLLQLILFIKLKFDNRGIFKYV